MGAKDPIGLMSIGTRRVAVRRLEQASNVARATDANESDVTSNYANLQR